MRSRNIKPGFFRDEQLMQVPPLGRLLFAGLWCLADREGRLPDRPAQIKWDILPADDCDIHALLNELSLRGFIRRYTADGSRYIEVTRFLAHQHPHPKEKASIIPPPPDTTPAQKHDLTRLIPDSLIPDILIPFAVSQPVADKSKARTDLSAAKKVTRQTSLAPLPSTAQQERSDTALSSTSQQARSNAALPSASQQAHSNTALPSTSKQECSDTAFPSASQQARNNIALSSLSQTVSNDRDPRPNDKTDRKANIFLSRRDGNTTRRSPCKQVKHEDSWIAGFFSDQ